MKKLFIAISAVSLGLASFAGGMTGFWTNVVETTTPTSPLLWTDSGNWTNGVPSTVDDRSDFYTSYPSSSAATRWIRLPDDLSLGKIEFYTRSGNLNFMGERLTLADGVTAHENAGDNFVRLYADLTAAKNATLYMQRTELCGDVTGGTLSPTYIVLRHRLDLYASAAGATRVNPCGASTLQPSNGYRFEMISPESSATDLSSDWNLSTESKIVTRVDTSVARHALPVGTRVTAANGALPEGTYLRRIYDDNTIELSETPTAAGATALTFVALTPAVTQTFNAVIHFGINSPFGFRFSKYRAEDSFRVTINDIARPSVGTEAECEATRTTFDTEPGLVPATLVLRQLYGVRTHVVLGTCDIEFAKPSADGYKLGFAQSPAVRQGESSAASRLSVAAGLTAVIPVFTNLVGSVEKAGAGTLEIGLTNAVGNTGSLTVSDGTLRVTENGDGALPYVKTLALGATGTLEIPATGFKADDFSFTAGATLKGGPLYLSNPADVAGLALADGAAVLYAKNDGTVSSAVQTFVASNAPAFWIDVMNENSCRGYSENGTNFVTRWADTRETDYDNPSYMFATNVGAYAPQRWTKQGVDSTFAYVYFANHKTTVAAEMEHLVWNVPLKNIRAVYMVRDACVGCGQALLGATARINSRREDFRRNSQDGVNIEHPFFQDNCSTYVKTGRHYMNGEPTTWNGYYPYGKYSNGNDCWFRPLVQEVHTSGDCWADCFGAYCPDTCTYTSFNGWDSICECLIFTNALTEAERLSVEKYLLDKWVKKTVEKDRFAEAGKSFETLTLSGSVEYGVAAAAQLNVGTLSGTGTLRKEGDGTLYVDRAQSATAGLTVAAGAAIVRSVRPTRATLPAGAYLHLDANDTPTMGTKMKDDNVTVGLETWADWRGDGYLTATHSTTNLPAVATVRINGTDRQVVDFGPKMTSSGETLVSRKSATSMTFTNAQQLRTVALVIGSRQGGGASIVGSTKGVADGGMPRANGGEAASDALYSTSGNYFPRYLHAGLYQNNRPGGTSWRVNGVEVNSRTTGLSGAFDLVTLRTPDPFASNALSAYNWGFHCGGQEIAEIIYWDRMLTDDEINRVEAYLGEKWFGTAPAADYAGATLGAVEVAAGATLTVEGGGPLVVSSLAGAGTVAGDIEFAAGAELALAVADDGTTAAASATSIDLRTAVAVRLTGTERGIRHLTVGRHVVFAAPSIHEGDLCAWTLANAPVTRHCRLAVIEGAVVLDVEPIGTTLILK